MRRIIAIVALMLVSAVPAYAQRVEVISPAPKVVDRSVCTEIPIGTAQIADAEFATVRIERPEDDVGDIAGYVVEARITPSLARKDAVGNIARLFTCKDNEQKDAVRFFTKVIATEDKMHVALVVLPQREKDLRIRSCAKLSETVFKCWRGTYTGDRVVKLSPE